MTRSAMTARTDGPSTGASGHRMLPLVSIPRTPAAAARRPRLHVDPSIGWLRPALPDRDLPAPESDLRRTTIRAIAVLALLVTSAYLAWRTTATLDLSVWWISVPLLVLEVHA